MEQGVFRNAKSLKTSSPHPKIIRGMRRPIEDRRQEGKRPLNGWRAKVLRGFYEGKAAGMPRDQFLDLVADSLETRDRVNLEGKPSKFLNFEGSLKNRQHRGFVAARRGGTSSWRGGGRWEDSDPPVARRRYSAILREEFGHTVSDRFEIYSDIHALCHALIAVERCLIR
jgi:hypothetical protein